MNTTVATTLPVSHLPADDDPAASELHRKQAHPGFEYCDAVVPTDAEGIAQDGQWIDAGWRFNVHWPVSDQPTGSAHQHYMRPRTPELSNREESLCYDSYAGVMDLHRTMSYRDWRPLWIHIRDQSRIGYVLSKDVVPRSVLMDTVKDRDERLAAYAISLKKFVDNNTTSAAMLYSEMTKNNGMIMVNGVPQSPASITVQAVEHHVQKVAEEEAAIEARVQPYRDLLRATLPDTAVIGGRQIIMNAVDEVVNRFPVLPKFDHDILLVPIDKLHNYPTGYYINNRTKDTQFFLRYQDMVTQEGDQSVTEVDMVSLVLVVDGLPNLDKSRFLMSASLNYGPATDLMDVHKFNHPKQRSPEDVLCLVAKVMSCLPTK